VPFFLLTKALQKQNTTKQNTTLAMGYFEEAETATATTVQASLATGLATDASELIEDLLIFPTTSCKEDSIAEEEKAETEKDSPYYHDDDYSDASAPSAASEEYHEFYLQREGMEFFLPILFEDGMDFVECEYYYASIQQHCTKKRSIRQQQTTHSSPISSSKWATLNQPKTQGKLASCIRRSDNHKRLRSSSSCSNEKKKKDPMLIELDRAVRRYSFSGMPQLAQEIPTLTRSQSWQHLSENRAGVGFEQHVRVVTIHQAMDYPEDVRRNMWMSREEMSSNMKRAMRKHEKQEEPPRRGRRSNSQEELSKELK
jgi:hypothetical protein